MTINPNGTEIEFPTPICPITEPHAKHIIPGTWREQCNGVEQCGREVVAWPYGECTEPTGHAGDCDRRATHRTVNHLVHPFVD